MSTWVIPCNPKTYDVQKALVAYGGVLEWTKTLATKHIQAGDIVYIYVVAPAGSLTMKFVVTNANVTQPVQRHRDQGAETGDSWFMIRFLQDIEPVTYDVLLKLGVVNGYIQSARLLKPNQEAVLAARVRAKNTKEAGLSDTSGKGNMMSPQYSKKGCPFCDALTKGKQYAGSLSERRTSEGRTIPWKDALSGVRLTRTIDFMADTGETFRGGEIHHDPRTHEADARAKNLVAFTVVRTGVKRYVLVQEDSPAARILHTIQTGNDLSDDEIEHGITSLDNLKDIEGLLTALRTTMPPQRVEYVIYRVVRNPKIARLVKERQSFICDICGRQPFRQKNGQLYAEADHIEPLGGEYGGLDTPENVRCLCAQCHAVITHGDEETKQQLLKEATWNIL